MPDEPTCVHITLARGDTGQSGNSSSWLATTLTWSYPLLHSLACSSPFWARKKVMHAFGQPISQQCTEPCDLQPSTVRIAPMIHSSAVCSLSRSVFPPLLPPHKHRLPDRVGLSGSLAPLLPPVCRQRLSWRSGKGQHRGSVPLHEGSAPPPSESRNRPL
jgi:hypothetical protein